MATISTTPTATTMEGFKQSRVFGNMNNVHNLTEMPMNVSESAEKEIEIYRTEQLVFLCILFILIVAGNASVLSLILLKKKRTGINFFLMHLAIADLSVGLVNVSTDIIWRATVVWLVGGPACKLIRFLNTVGTYSSTFLLVAMSIDRLDAIASPMNFTGKGLRIKILVGMAWFFGLVCSIPQAVLNNVQVHDSMGLQCYITVFSRPWHWQAYVSVIAVVIFIAPTIIMTVCYTIIVVTIWNKGQLIPPLQQRTPKVFRTFVKPKRHELNVNMVSAGSPRLGNGRASSEGLIPKAKIKSIKLSLVIVLVFVLCWLPYFVFDLMDVYGQIPFSQQKVKTAIFINALAPLNSAANPLIYCIFSTTLCVTKSKWLRTIFPFCCESNDRDPIEIALQNGSDVARTEVTYLDTTSSSIYSSPSCDKRLRNGFREHENQILMKQHSA
ncbi:unnamed protein product [Owenia fusiformis]|uniref:G-protein coupled receptors family 1 profile domain-containing protein n=1 Tax=Owenia fusiformis TaxID=6347 RepID=A0A8S4P848_OWEFU|nr:unnamed protein product [Owenia fusiformis]